MSKLNLVKKGYTKPQIKKARVPKARLLSAFVE